jgi:hypothetical protein
VKDGRLTLAIEPQWRILAGEAVRRRLETLGKTVKRETAISF